MSFVNGRAVNDPVIKSAVATAARELAGNWALFFTLEPSLVDVNIHPAKAEVRFRYPEEIYSSLHNAVKRLGSPGYIPEISARNVTEPVRISPSPKTSSPSSSRSGWNFRDAPTELPRTNRIVEARQVDLFADFEAETQEPSVNFMGQNSGGYLVYDTPEGLTLVDPHAAHERINYERIKSSAEKSQNVQKLLVPVILHPTLAIETAEFETALMDSGFEFGNTEAGIEIRAVPAIGSVEFEPEALLRASLRALKNNHDGDTRNILWRTWATMACKASVKLTTKLARDEALALWRELHECEQPYVCPHGRPVMIELKNEDLLRRFGRE
ncbi:MAG: hypothetical protein II832_02335 [Synergistaceae bacterium]|nr:hypothetical protein [Synergistaceae bacterium]